MIDRTRKRDDRDKRRRKGRRPVHGRSLVHIMNAILRRAKGKK